jgi:Ca2+-binding RTX toxin-like protein
MGVRGQPLTYTLSAVENGLAAGALLTYRIDWNGDGRVDQVLTGPSGLTVAHAFASAGKPTVQVTVVDPSGNVSPLAATQAVTVQAVLLEADPANSSQTALVLGGTPGSDAITIRPMDPSGTLLAVTINGVAQPGPQSGAWAPTGHVLVYGQAGNDTIQEVANQGVQVEIPALLFAGSGNVTLSAAGSSAGNVLVGGAGHDVLTGGSGRDILIGGSGTAALHGGSGGDVLIAGSTAYDADPVALSALALEWSRTDVGYPQRVQDLFGDGTGGLNGSYLLNAQAVARHTTVDELIGGSGSDWFWFSQGAKTADQISNFAAGEFATLASLP